MADFLRAQGERVLERWRQVVSGTIHPTAMPKLELVDHLPLFVALVAENLHESEAPEAIKVAAEHGVQRLGLGFSLDAVVREYGALQQAIIDVAKAQGVMITESERARLSSLVTAGIADAVSEYQRQRDAELQRHMNEHFAFIAHELRNPLGSSLSALGVLERKGVLDPSERFSRVLHRGLTRMHELIDSTLRAAQLASGVTLRREVSRLAELLDDVDAAAAANAEERSVSLAFKLEDDAELSVDRRLVHSALSNLVRNAVKFSHEGGSVEVRARTGPGRVIIEVEDSCGGLARDEVQKVFAPFTQLGGDGRGFGLGLAIAKQAADAHGGSIRVQNLPGKGCIFVLELPTLPPLE